jgi:hypothetical protein
MLSSGENTSFIKLGDKDSSVPNYTRINNYLQEDLIKSEAVVTTP